MARLTVKQAAEYVPCAVSTLNHLRVKGGGPVYIKGELGKILYDTKDIDDWLESNKQRSTSENPPTPSRTSAA